MNGFTHQAVLLGEAVQALAIRADGVYVDGTFGRGGHTAAILAALGPAGRLLALDRDPAAEQAAQRFVADPRFCFERARFGQLAEVVARHQWAGRVNGLLLDIGVSSPQLDDPQRGFSFSREGPLDMRMDPTTGMSAADWLATADEAELAQVFRDFGEERFHRRVARAIVATRQETPLLTTTQLARLIAAHIPTRERGQHPATRCFQAIRIYINRELDELEAALLQAVHLLAQGGRLAVISFHSLEDRIVKRFLRREALGPDLPLDLPVLASATQGTLRLVGRAVAADDHEVAANPRARSARLRIAERL